MNVDEFGYFRPVASLQRWVGVFQEEIDFFQEKVDLLNLNSVLRIFHALAIMGRGGPFQRWVSLSTPRDPPSPPGYGPVLEVVNCAVETLCFFMLLFWTGTHAMKNGYDINTKSDTSLFLFIKKTCLFL